MKHLLILPFLALALLFTGCAGTAVVESRPVYRSGYYGGDPYYSRSRYSDGYYAGRSRGYGYSDNEYSSNRTVVNRSVNRTNVNVNRTNVNRTNVNRTNVSRTNNNTRAVQVQSKGKKKKHYDDRNN